MRSKSFWLIDIGNSSISVVRKIGARFDCLKEFYENEIPKITPYLSKSGGKNQIFSLLCSVVPESEKKILKYFKHYKNFKYLRLGQDIPIRIKCNYFNINKLGNDRKVNTYGALKVLRPPVLIFDFGTATTVDYISRSGAFEGGLILPGIKSSLDLLHEKTALLPAVRIRPVKTFLGRDTRTGMLAGVLYGYGAMVDGLIAQFKRRYGKNLKTIATGGLVDIISKYCGGFDRVDRFLTLRAMSWIYEDHLARSH